ncbi:MAG: putative M23-family peptidase [Mycobacterium sp.]|nr:putative M23-family peptidase [Mycobacterium sp.]
MASPPAAVRSAACGSVGQGIASDVKATGVACTIAREIGGSVYAGDTPPLAFSCTNIGPVTFGSSSGTGHRCTSPTTRGTVEIDLGPVDAIGVADAGTSSCSSASGCFQVTTGGGSVNVRNGPSTTAAILATLKNGDHVSALCRTAGELVGGPAGSTSYWDSISPTGLVSDAFVGAADRLPDC